MLMQIKSINYQQNGKLSYAEKGVALNKNYVLFVVNQTVLL